MLAPIGTFLDALLTSAAASVVLPMIGLGLLLAGGYWIFGNHEHGKSRATWALIGGAVMLMARPLAAALAGGVPH